MNCKKINNYFILKLQLFDVHLHIKIKEMSKKKKKKPIKYPHLISKEYLVAVANKLWSMNPTEKITFNTLVGVWKEGYNKGYFRRQEEIVRVRQKQESRLEEEFKQFTDYLDDKIHDKSGMPLSFEEWQKNQKELIKKII